MNVEQATRDWFGAVRDAADATAASASNATLEPPPWLGEFEYIDWVMTH